MKIVVDKLNLESRGLKIDAEGLNIDATSSELSKLFKDMSDYIKDGDAKERISFTSREVILPVADKEEEEDSRSKLDFTNAKIVPYNHEGTSYKLLTNEHYALLDVNSDGLLLTNIHESEQILLRYDYVYFTEVIANILDKCFDLYPEIISSGLTVELFERNYDYKVISGLIYDEDNQIIKLKNKDVWNTANIYKAWRK